MFSFRLGGPFVLATVLLCAANLCAEGPILDWKSRVIRMPRDDGQGTKPPVITAVSMQPGGRQLAIAGDDHLVRIWDTERDELVRRLDGHIDWVRTVAYSPDGTILASAGNDRRIILWNAQTGERIRVLANHDEAVTKIVYSHQGKMLVAIGFAKKLQVYDSQIGRELLTLNCPCRDMRAAAFSPDDSILASGGGCGTIRLYETQGGRHLRDITGHRRRIRQLFFTQDGQQIISCSDDRTIRVADVSGQESFALPQRSTKVMAMTLFAAGRLATAGSDNLIRFWDIDSKAEIGRLSGHTGSVVTLANEGDVLVSGSYDTTMRIWNMDRNVAESPRRPLGRVGSGAFKAID